MHFMCQNKDYDLVWLVNMTLKMIGLIPNKDISSLVFFAHAFVAVCKFYLFQGSPLILPEYSFIRHKIEKLISKYFLWKILMFEIKVGRQSV